jgi:TolB protein
MKTVFGSLIVFSIFLGSCSNFGGSGGTIAFESYRNGEAEVYLMDSNGENQRNITNSEAYDGTPSWSLDGSQIAITSERNGNPEVHLIDIDSGEAVQVTDGKGFNVLPDWSPDDKTILFSSNRTYKRQLEGGELEIPGNTKIWTHDLESGEETRLTGGLGLDMFGSWSPDGESVVFMSARDANPEIYIQEPDRSAYNITNHESQDLNPSWSPDGLSVVFMSDRDGNMEIYLLNLGEEGDLINLTNHPANDGDPAWSPDGKQLAFTSDRDGNIEIYVMNVDGSGVVRLTNDPADDIHPSWQP